MEYALTRREHLVVILVWRREQTCKVCSRQHAPIIAPTHSNALNRMSTNYSKSMLDNKLYDDYISKDSQLAAFCNANLRRRNALFLQYT